MALFLSDEDVNKAMCDGILDHIRGELRDLLKKVADEEIEAAVEAATRAFSAHAKKRMSERGIYIDVVARVTK